MRAAELGSAATGLRQAGILKVKDEARFEVCSRQLRSATYHNIYDLASLLGVSCSLASHGLNEQNKPACSLAGQPVAKPRVTGVCHPQPRQAINYSLVQMPIRTMLVAARFFLRNGCLLVLEATLTCSRLWLGQLMYALQQKPLWLVRACIQCYLILQDLSREICMKCGAIITAC